jgi:hypothetical protein
VQDQLTAAASAPTDLAAARYHRVDREPVAADHVSAPTDLAAARYHRIGRAAATGGTP